MYKPELVEKINKLLHELQDALNEDAGCAVNPWHKIQLSIRCSEVLDIRGTLEKMNEKGWKPDQILEFYRFWKPKPKWYKFKARREWNAQYMRMEHLSGLHNDEMGSSSLWI